MSDEKFLEELDIGQYGDYDIEVSLFEPPVSFKRFVHNPFSTLPDHRPIECKTGQIKLPKSIIEHYIGEKNWNPANYHATELLAIIYIHYYKDCDEWKNEDFLKSEITEILEALPHFSTIEELIKYSYILGDFKLEDFENIIDETDKEITDIADD